MDIDGDESDEEYVVDSNEWSSFEDDDDEEFAPKTPIEVSRRYLLPVPYPIPVSVLSDYHTLDLDPMQQKNLFSNTGEDGYNFDDGVEFRVGHRIKSRDAVMQGVKNYSICRSTEYRVMNSDRIKYHVHYRQSEAGCPWRLRVAFRQNLRYW
ncbi:hypothetical protein Ahy_B04g070097 [Arachis hypogaea]|uniref:Transposase MuDR plant domain-containing protein n=1 Tax=Arachis hypogaea TaxID=3818 RepID=A0A444ZES9_ARAHY|nr:hypothetical protein Ahy_B04g070097 [Arachis hypogaea]